jgi:hypothetical protein
MRNETTERQLTTSHTATARRNRTRQGAERRAHTTEQWLTHLTAAEGASNEVSSIFIVYIGHIKLWSCSS